LPIFAYFYPIFVYFNPILTNLPYFHLFFYYRYEDRFNLYQIESQLGTTVGGSGSRGSGSCGSSGWVAVWQWLGGSVAVAVEKK
jgi:hypothetical protein